MSMIVDRLRSAYAPPVPGREIRPMSESGQSKPSVAERSVAAQERYVVPVLLVVAVIAVIAVWVVGAIPWWVAVPVLILGALAVAQRVRGRA